MKVLDSGAAVEPPCRGFPRTREHNIWQHTAFFAELIAAALIGALLEVQIEGGDGWATSLPTREFRMPAWTRPVLGARTVTGYHALAQLFMLVILHAPYALGFVRPSVSAELRILSFLVLFWVVEDFLWFVVNPAWGIRRFRRSEVWWHAPTWWGFMPRDYWIGLPLGIALYLLSR